MENIVIDQANTRLLVEKQRLVVRPDSAARSAVSFPLRQLRSLIIVADCDMSSHLLRQLGKAGVTLFCLNARRYQDSMIAYSLNHGNSLRRLAQYGLWQDGSHSMRLSRWLVRRKIQKCRQVLGQLSELRSDLRRAAVKADAHLQRSLLSCRAAADTQALLGVEGLAARYYFSAYSSAFPPSMGFESRNRRPPLDPVNALLSLTYSLLHYEAARACLAYGLDPEIGVFHAPSYGRESLACDMVELFRADADIWVWHLIRERQLREHHFKKEGSGCFLDKNGREIFFPAYQNQIKHWRKRMWLYAQWFARFLDKRQGELR